MKEHATTLHTDGHLKNPMYQARCTCGWETSYLPQSSASKRAKTHRAEMGNK